MSEKLVVDRIEGNLAIIEHREGSFEIPIACLPPQTKEGDYLTIQNHAPEQSDQDNENKERLKRLQERDSGQNIIDL